MKKYIEWIVLLILCLFLCGCHHQKQQPYGSSTYQADKTTASAKKKVQQAKQREKKKNNKKKKNNTSHENGIEASGKALETAKNQLKQGAKEQNNGWKGLETQLKQQISQYQGHWAVCVKDLKQKQSIRVATSQSDSMTAASLIKLYVMAATYEAINDNRLSLAEHPEITGKIQQMIMVSSNEDTNDLIVLLGNGSVEQGVQVVNDYINRAGYTATRLQRTLMDSRYSYRVGENLTSVHDCCRILERIYRGQCVNETASAEMLRFLKGQTRRHKIPAGIANGITVANKTGELADTENDVAIVFLDNHPYILCVMSVDLQNAGQARQNIVGISTMVYQYFSK